jgi:hypothetical protein
MLLNDGNIVTQRGMEIERCTFSKTLVKFALPFDSVHGFKKVVKLSFKQYLR